MGFLSKWLYSHKVSTFQIISFSFALLILMGTVLLMLPCATASGESAGFLTAWFTATSASCVTGLVLQDTALYWSLFGKIVILVLIQVGGVGVVTIAVLIALAAGKKIDLMQRGLMNYSISSPHAGGTVSLTQFIARSVVLIELVGALVMWPSFAGVFGVWKGLGAAVFHSVSAFCNAGFDLMGTKSGAFSSLTSFANNPVINIVVMTLIILGGLGFLTWQDVLVNRFRLPRCRLQTKLILSASLVLILVPAALFFFFEYGDVQSSQRVWMSLFQSVTARTAGFNTADLSAMSESGQMLMIILMLIGGSPGSTAGGMKTTTAVILFSWLSSAMHRESRPKMFGRRITQNSANNAATVLMLYLVLFLGGSMIISRLDHLPLLACMFETASAVGTVGLTLGLTTKLCASSHVILIALMFIGRVGGMTLAYAAIGRSNYEQQYPQEDVMVG